MSMCQACGECPSECLCVEEMIQSTTKALQEQLKAADALARAAKPLLEAFEHMRSDHHDKLVKGQTFESAQENWATLVQEPLELGSLIEALAAYEKARGVK